MSGVVPRTCLRLALRRASTPRPSTGHTPVRQLCPTTHCHWQFSGRLAAVTSARASHGASRNLSQAALASVQPKASPNALVLTTCPGCGAFAQFVEPDVAGYYTSQRRVVRKYFGFEQTDPAAPEDPRDDEDAIFSDALARIDPAVLDELTSSGGSPEKQTGAEALPSHAVSEPKASPPPSADAQLPVCDRCHALLHHNSAQPIAHPSLDSIQEIIAESPHKQNHVYHVLDAADFPMSLVPQIYRILSLAPQRSQNRRARHAGYRHGRKAELSFVITRSDLLAPTKQQVDRLMPILVEILRDALGRTAKGMRLGNVKCVSARRGWWTKELKADIWDRGGAGWMVGKVNVGKSNLFEAVFPKGNAEDVNFDKVRRTARLTQIKATHAALESGQISTSSRAGGVQDAYKEDSLLPPARIETPYPSMPTVSALPGTTASPIRIPFGNGRGELIDLPGLSRDDIASFVRPEHREKIMMKKRIIPEQHNITSGRSLLLDGLIRLRPTSEDVTILAYPFVELKQHLTSTGKVSAYEAGERAPPMEFITEEGVAQNLKSAGVFELKHDVTKQRAGPLTARDAVALKAHQLPFKVLSTDILIEGIGWVEVVAQVRRKDFENHDSDLEDGSGQRIPNNRVPYPAVEVFSPQGRFVSARRPLGAWLLGRARLAQRNRPSSRSRRRRRGPKT